MTQSDYRHTNNVKHFIDGIPARQWCTDHNASYACFYNRIKAGEDIQSIKKYLLEKYSNQVTENSLEDIAGYIRFKYITLLKNNDPIGPLKRWFYSRDMSVADKDYVWNLVSNGNVKPKKEIEIWKEIDGFKGVYVSNFGHFKRKLKGNIKYKYYKAYKKVRYRGKTRTDRITYCVKVKGKELNAAKIVATHFIPNPKNFTYTYQIDGDPSNLHYSNIRWMSKSEWGKRTAHLAASKPVRVRKKFSRKYKDYRSVRTAAKHLNVSYQAILDYMNPKNRPQNSVLSGLTIKYI